MFPGGAGTRKGYMKQGNPESGGRVGRGSRLAKVAGVRQAMSE